MKSNRHLLKDMKPSLIKGDEMTRRKFAKKVMGIGFLSSLALMNLPDLALAWLDGGFSQREDLGDALNVLIKTYSNTEVYPHKFYDALVKQHLRNLDFSVRKGFDKEYVEFSAIVLGPVIERHIKPAIQKFGKDMFLWGIFERTCCSYQLFEHIEIKEGERSFPCPYKVILEQIQKTMGTYKITWDDVHHKHCIPVWSGFAKKAGVEIKVEPGEICRVKVV